MSNYQWKAKGNDALPEASSAVISALALVKDLTSQSTSSASAAEELLLKSSIRHSCAIERSGSPLVLALTNSLRVSRPKAKASHEKPLKSCLKKSPSFDKGSSSYYTDSNDGSEHTRRPSLNAKTQRHGGNLPKASSSPVLESKAKGHQNRRRNRRRRTSDPNKPTKGILKKTSSYSSMRYCSEPHIDTTKPKRRVSFAVLNISRWDSEGSSLNLTSLTSKQKVIEGDSRGNPITGEDHKGKQTKTRSLSCTNLPLLYQELDARKPTNQAVGRYQAPSRPSRRGSTDHSGVGEMNSRTSANVFQASVNDFHSVLVHDMFQTTNSAVPASTSLNTAPCKPRRQGSFKCDDGSAVLKESVSQRKEGASSA